MNPNLPITVPVRISQSVDDLRVQANPAPLPGTDALVEELQTTNRVSMNILYRRYGKDEVSKEDPLGVHFATIDHDTDELTEWLDDHLTTS
ncbi:hypothetical protein QMK19_38775 [Streptomyces sp. H10-C2]|uniref:hypothetical protein n=1 Tax=unclassified Streptomyces TaxID=2593676 RepID=UPI0024B954C8|nr:MULTISPECIES: hypothetical protein [unclassified Streptomyces]MDJ0347135.1 hypothetical protein [Streptomyces sp. PH10-H1]MDJ0375381.1 hypothetical protein [Streptomyces sp. H10-C2]